MHHRTKSLLCLSALLLTTGCGSNQPTTEPSVGGDTMGGSSNLTGPAGGNGALGGQATGAGATTTEVPASTGGNSSGVNAGGTHSIVSGTGGAASSSATTEMGGRSSAIAAGSSTSSSPGKPSGGTSARTSGAKAMGGTATGSTLMNGGSASALGGASATSGTIGKGCGAGTSTSNDIVVNLGSLQQKITGFGVSSAWAGSYADPSHAEYLWSTTKGAGLTLLRIRYGDGLAIAKSAASYGVTVWMTPWGTGTNGSPGGAFTTTQTNPNGCKGSMPVLTNPSGFANALVTWVQNAKTQGVPIYAVSAGNEPDSCGINQTTSYSAAQMATWIETLGPAMANIDVKLMAPETMNWYGFPGYFTAIKNNALAYGYVDIFAGHRYGLGPDSKNSDVLTANKAIAADTSKEYWQTEVDTGTASGDSSGDGIASALLMAKQMHADLTVANLNAWHLWWLYNASGNGGFLFDTTNKVWSKRLWVLGNYSRYVRPGYKRVATSGAVPSGVLLTAYTNPADGTVVLVAVNTNTSAANLSVFITGAAPCSMTPYVTSSSDSLASKASVTVSGSRFTFSVGAQSVTTFVGKP
ncbi:MAG: glycoside hydrolase [Myxococcales bacterium]